METQNILSVTAQQVEQQLLAEPTMGIPVDPDIAEYMGAHKESALTPDDLAEDFLLTPHGEVLYEQE